MEYRFARPEEEDDLLDFINMVFSQAVRPHHFQALHAKAYAHPGFSSLHAVAVEDGRIRGTIAVLPLTLRMAGAVLKGGYVGSVAVHEKARSQGCMGRLMEMQLEKARALSYDFLVLGGRRQRYGYYGFERTGGAAAFTITADNVRHGLGNVEALEIRRLSGPEDAALPLIGNLQDTQIVACERPRDRLYDTLRTWEAVPYTVWGGAAGDFRGYFVEKDDTLTEVALVHPEDLPALIKAWMQGKRGCRVRLPLWDQEGIRQISAFAETSAIGDGEMWHILNWPRVLQGALTVKRQTQGLPLGRIVVDIGGLRLAIRNTVSEVTVQETADPPLRELKEKQAMELFFSPLAALTEQDPALRSWLPLALAIPPADQF